MGDVTDFTGTNVRPYPHIEELSKKIHDAIDEHAGDVSMAEAIGMLEIIKTGLLLSSLEVDEE